MTATIPDALAGLDFEHEVPCEAPRATGEPADYYIEVECPLCKVRGAATWCARHFRGYLEAPAGQCWACPATYTLPEALIERRCIR